jgi:hypothetical protein
MSTTLQSIADLWAAFDKNPWKDPVGWDCKTPCSPSTNTTGASGNNGFSPYNAMGSQSFSKHLNQWHYNCKNGSKKCMVCQNTSQDKAHNTKDCPILKKLGLKLVKRTPANNNTASWVGQDRAPPAQPAAASPALVTPSAESGGSGSAPGAFNIATKPEISYNSGNKFGYES